MNMPFSLFLDIIIAGLLIVTIGYALVLNSRIGMLRKDKAQLEKLALNFSEATNRAEVSISELGTSIDVLQERIKRSESLREDLVFLVERGNRTADNLEELIRAARDNVEAAPRQSRDELTTGSNMKNNSSEKESALEQRNLPDADVDTTSEDDLTSDAEQELLKALRSAG